MDLRFNTSSSESGLEQGSKLSNTVLASRKPRMLLDPYAAPLNKREVIHLLRRTGFGASPAAIEAHLGRSASEVVDQLLEEATNTAITPLPSEPGWASLPVPDRETNTAEEIKEYNQNNRIFQCLCIK